GESPVLDPNAPSTCIGGREVVVERRCVVRMEVSGRCVAVRCRPARRLRHVLRPVIARYASPTAMQQPKTVLRDGVVVHPDTSMQELDGARLQIVELNEEAETARSERRDDDADSLSDLALGLPDDQKDDTQSNASRASAAASSSGRVRAALRPGPPLHHHPPDFLENLRETQRQRLHKGDVGPAPRTPPPLPPKPARTPTLV
ncbi:uncharacterized protein LOC113236357, partial [Hyposmocoma kahamanoa]|uniref:uncharacterized protein LOC113236357 n=1 Tax=Hyposmocoma kahamanoa TaxID=1477025 RepID=UPI000E6D8AEB